MSNPCGVLRFRMAGDKMFGEKSERDLTKAVTLLAQRIDQFNERQHNEFEWFRSHLKFATKDDLKEMEGRIMAAFDDLKKELGVINGTTNEIAADIDELITKLSSPNGLTEAQAAEIVADLQSTSTALKGIAAKYPAPTPPVEE